MSFFRNYLANQQQKIDEQFREHDESWFVFALLQLRLGFRGYPIQAPLIPSPPLFFLDPMIDPLSHISPGHELLQALRFVSSFVCFFIPKPPKYNREIKRFKDYFIPGFTESMAKVETLYRSVLPSFSTTPLEEAKWETVEDYFRMEFLNRFGGGFVQEPPINPQWEPPRPRL